MAESILHFVYKGQEIKISCKKNEIMKNIYNIYANKTNQDIKNICFLYNGNKINGDLKLEQINSKDYEIKITVIDVINDKKEELKKIKDIICPECGQNCMINIDDYKITLYCCKNGHRLSNVLFDEFLGTQKLYELTMICNDCKINKTNNTNNNQFYKCCHCNINLCPSCKQKHNKQHNVIDYELKHYICNIHGGNFISYCKNCNINLCHVCEINHSKDHSLVNYKDILRIKNGNKYLSELSINIEKLKNEFKILIINSIKSL